jgi:formylglycine-generating enzyme
MAASSSTDGTAGMVRLEGGTFAMGSDNFYPEEAPVRRVRVDPFWIDAAPVTNEQFARFVAETGHVTLAEIAPDPKDYPGMLPGMDRAGSLVFDPPPGPVDLGSLAWWSFRFGANWRSPLGPGSTLDGLGDHPVVHVAHGDAAAYAAWAGKQLPSEAEWEFAARAGLDGADYAWGDELAPGGAMLANYWQGQFPNENALDDGWLRTSPVGFYPPNAYGLFDMIGNIWEWTDDWYALPRLHRKQPGHCCVPSNPRGGTRGGSMVKGEPTRIPRKVLKGGSHLCAENYCCRYRPAARYPQTVDSATSHIGFRCVVRER